MNSSAKKKKKGQYCHHILTLMFKKDIQSKHKWIILCRSNYLNEHLKRDVESQNFHTSKSE